MIFKKSALLTCAATLAVVAASGSAWAQDAAPAAAAPESGGLQDIVVTARRTSESLQKTPIAVSALNSSALEKINVQQVDKIAQVVPNLVISQQSSALSASSIMIRGIGQTDPSLGLDTAVGVYLDGVYVARSAGSIFDLVDLERIEVLRGPQGTLFGRNTTGGAIQLVSKKPSDEFGLTVKGGYGTRNNWYGRVRMDTGKIGNSPFSAALTYYHRQKDGYFDNTLTPKSKDPGSLNVDAYNIAVRADLDNVQINYSYDYDNRTGAPGFFQTVALSDAALAYYSRSASLGGAPLQYVGADTRLTSGQQQPGFDNHYTSKTVSQGHNLTASWQASDAFTLKSITGYRKLHLFNVLGLSGQGDLKGVVFDPTSPTFTSVQSVTPYNGYNGPQNQKQFSEELQALGKVGDFSYVVGLYYFREKVSEDNHQFLTAVLPGSTFGLPLDYVGLNLNPEAKYHQTSKSYAAFGQVSWRPQALDEKLEVTGGIRYTKDKKFLRLENSTYGVPNVSNTSGGVSFDNVSFLGSVSYQVTPQALTYAKVSTGYKSGGFNPRADGICNAPAPDGTCPTGVGYHLNTFKPEKLTSFEIGAKTDFFDRHLRINVAAFYSKYSDLQVPQFASGSGGATTLLVNAGKADFKGVELEVTAIPVRGLTLSGSLGYTDPKYKQFLFLDPATNMVTDIASSARFPAVAKFNSNVAAEYDFEPMSFGQLSARVSYAYRSHVYFYPNDAVNPFQKQVASPATNNVDARIALSDMPVGNRAKAEIAVLGENLLNEDQVVYGIDFGGLGFGGKFYSEPRRFMVEFKLTY
ncbi:TonB-dependent receptor [Flavisphingomonas formosensis]|uniref:TonB-dependent receptor n=1 Tax=Flavisphingomonas formosensis TaxID=861534 RepID=UPI0012FC04E2|nr:TonB-dependent receptor [Sphingomonas formosensis]